MQQATTATSNPSINKPIDSLTGGSRRVLANTGALAASNLWRIVTSFVLTLLVSRRLGVEGLGYYVIALTYLNVCQVISEMGLPNLLTRDLAQEPTYRRSYFRWALVVQISLSLITWGVLIVASRLLPLEETSRTILWLIGASLPFYACTSVCQTLFQASERMEYIFGVEVTINSLILALSVGLLWIGQSIVALVSVLILTQLLSSVLCLWFVRRARLLAGEQQVVQIDLRQLWRGAAPFYSLALADVLLQRLDTLLLSVVAGVTLTGIYGAADNLVRVLIKLVQSLWKALYPTLSRLQQQSPDKYQMLHQNSLRYAMILFAPLALLSTIAAGWVMQLVYDASYAAHANVLQAEIWSAPAFLIELYTVTLLMVERKPLRSLLITGLHILTVALCLPLFTYLWGAVGAAMAVVAAGMVGVGMGFWQLHRLRLNLDWRSHLTIAGCVAVSGIAAWLLSFLWQDNNLLWIQLLLSSATYLLLLGLTRTVGRDDLRAAVGLLLNVTGKK